MTILPAQDPAPPLEKPYHWITIQRDDNLALLYHENTRRYHFGAGLDQRPSGPPLDLAGREIAVSKNLLPPDHKGVLQLPRLPHDALGLAPLAETLRNRRSVRAFESRAIPLEALSGMLWAAYGVNRQADGPHGRSYFRTVASAGARFPLELYVAIRRVEGLAPGLYHYRPEPHVLETLTQSEPTTAIAQAILDGDVAREAPVVLLISAVWHRNMDKYGERGYRAVLMECGAVLQNLGLAAQALGLGGVALDGIDELMDTMVGADGFVESSLVSMAIGQPADPSPREGPA